MAGSAHLSHVALRVEDVHAAQDLYSLLLDLEIVFRDPGGARSMLGAGELHLALERGDAVAGPGRLAHVGLRVGARELPELRRRATALDCTVISESEHTLVVEDPLGVRWEVTDSAAG